ncbi:MAG TPA: Gfo/Idh/MocA family oxidoreductase [Ruminiclostridium sp.]
MENIRIGLVGCGTIGGLHAKLINELNGVELVAVADPNLLLTGELNKLYGCHQYNDYRKMLEYETIDIVSVCVPPALHYQVVIDAAQARKHVIIEKPMDIALNRADCMINECRKFGVKLSVISQHRFDTVIQILKEAIAEGRFGKLLMATSRTIWYRDLDYYTVHAWRGTSANGGGALMNQSIHYIDLLQYIMGDVKSVSGVCETLYHKSIEVEDTGIAIMKFESGAIGMIEGTTIAYPGLYSELNIYGEKGTISIKNDKLDFYKLKDGIIPKFDELLKKEDLSDAAVSRPEDLDMRSHKKQYEDVIAAVKQNRDPLVSGEEGRKAIAIINAIYESSSKGSWIEIN